MKLIRAIIRPEREPEVLAALEAEGFYAVTKMPVRGRGRQRGVRVGTMNYDELAKLMLLVAVEDESLARALAAVETGAWTGRPGDGRIFVQNIARVYTIRGAERSA
jgi:nitrogen regulatory protein PII 1